MDFQQKDPGIRAIMWEQMTELKKVLEDAVHYETHWDPECISPEGFYHGRISWELVDVNFYEKADWPKIYSFFQKHLMEFDSFYQEFNDILITLVD